MTLQLFSDSTTSLLEHDFLHRTCGFLLLHPNSWFLPAVVSHTKEPPNVFVSIRRRRQHTSAYVSIRQHTSAYVVVVVVVVIIIIIIRIRTANVKIANREFV